MKKILFLFVTLNLLSGSADSQITGTTRNFNPVPATPNAAAFQKYGDLPINYNTGIPQIEVPIYTISVKDFSWPLSLSYHASGFKSEDIASRVGLGWVIGGNGIISSKQSTFNVGTSMAANYWLNLGGQTSTVIPCIYTYSNQNDIDFADGIVNGTIRVTPNFYYLNAGPINGRFVEDRMLPASDIKIQPYGSVPGTIDKWTVYDGGGNRFEFNDKGDNYRSSACQGMASMSVNPSYYLSKIKTTKGDSIVFIYDDETYSYRQPDLHIIKTVDPNQLAGCYSQVGPEDYYCENTYTAHEKRLKTIETSTGTFVEFFYSSRSDLPGCTKIDRIAISYKRNGVATLIRSVDLLYSYFGQGTDPYGLQLKLNQVNFKGSSNNFISNYSFLYNTTLSLPNKLSQPIIFTNPGSSTGSGYYDISEAGILEKITYPTGGYTTFAYEVLHGFGILRVKEIKNFAVDNQSTGFRKFEYNDTPLFTINGVFTENETTKYFGNPTNGGPLSTVNEGSYCLYFPSVEELILSCNRTVWKSTPIRNTIQDLMEESPRFANVTEYFGGNGENGKIDYLYGAYDIGSRAIADADYLTKPENLKEKKFFKKNTDGSYALLNRTINQYEIPGCGSDLFEPSPSIGKEKRFWIKHVFRTRNEMPLSCVGGGTLGGYCFPKQFFEQNFRITSVPLYLKQTVEENYGGTDIVSVTTNYFYENPNHLKPTRSESIDSKGNLNKTEYKYPHDFSTVSPYNEMINRNIISPVIEQIQSKNTTTLSKVKNNFLFWNGNSLIEQSSIEKSLFGNPLETEITVNSYDIYGNVLQFTGKDGVAKSFIWDYMFLYPIAQCTNAGNTSVAFTSFEADGKGNWSYNSNGLKFTDGSAPTGKKVYALSTASISKSVSTAGTYIVSYWSKSGQQNVNSTTPASGRSLNGWTYYEHKVTLGTGGTVTISGAGIIDELRLYPEKALMTSMTYEPLVGMTSQCDPNNRIVYYEYDEFQRLILVRNQDGNIMKKICYNYSGQTENCNIYYNTLQQSTYTKACSAGYTGSDVSYTIPAGTYISTISQADVDYKAWNDILANGQAYANALGTCTQSSCTPYNCTGEEYKCVYGVCEQGVKVYTYIEQINANLWTCTYHYEWSDGSWSQDYYQESPYPCQ